MAKKVATAKKAATVKKEQPKKNPPSRVTIDKVEPSVDEGRFPAKCSLQENTRVSAAIFADGHDEIATRLKYWHTSEPGDSHVILLRKHVNDQWFGNFQVTELGIYNFQIEAWVDRYHTWLSQAKKKWANDQLEEVDLLEGLSVLEGLKSRNRKKAEKSLIDERMETLQGFVQNPGEIGNFEHFLDDPMLKEIALHSVDQPSHTKSAIFRLHVEAPIAGFSSWYEFFPRSMTNGEKRHGTLQDAIDYLPTVADMGFSVVYLPPIHPIGRQFRKGRNNSPQATSDDVGSPWAIGGKEGGHKAIHPDLGTVKDFQQLIDEATRLNLKVAMDIAFQCSPDHPYVKEHPEWFYIRPDGRIHYAENPPKKYQDIYPINFDTSNWQELWDELKSIFIFWRKKGVSVFRVDNPHTKSFPFWQWALAEIQREFPDTVFLSEAFTRPHRMYWLAKAGFSQSYTYFTWRYSKAEIIEYMQELTSPPVKNFFRPNFWPNTPDILAQSLRHAGRPTFVQRFVLASTLSSNYGIYGPAFELMLNEPYDHKTEEYLESEKYELKYWAKTPSENSLAALIKRVNRIRNAHPALQRTDNIDFLETQNDQLLAYLKSENKSQDYLLIIVNMDVHNTHSGFLSLPRSLIPVEPDRAIQVHDLISDEHYDWDGDHHYIELNPNLMPAHIFHISNPMPRRLNRLTE